MLCEKPLGTRVGRSVVEAAEVAARDRRGEHDAVRLPVPPEARELRARVQSD